MKRQAISSVRQHPVIESSGLLGSIVAFLPFAEIARTRRTCRAFSVADVSERLGRDAHFWNGYELVSEAPDSGLARSLYREAIHEAIETKAWFKLKRLAKKVRLQYDVQTSWSPLWNDYNFLLADPLLSRMADKDMFMIVYNLADVVTQKRWKWMACDLTRLKRITISDESLSIIQRAHLWHASGLSNTSVSDIAPDLAACIMLARPRIDLREHRETILAACKTRDGRDACVQLAVQHGHAEVIRWMKSFEPELHGHADWFELAAEWGQLDVLRELSFSLRSYDALVAVRAAVRFGRIGVVRRLQWDFWLTMDKLREAALDDAVGYGRLSIVRFLGVHRTPTALLMRMFGGNFEMMTGLAGFALDTALRHYVHDAYPTDDGGHLLSRALRELVRRACHGGQLRVVRYLIDEASLPFSTDDVLEAAAEGWSHVVFYLITHPSEAAAELLPDVQDAKHHDVCQRLTSLWSYSEQGHNDFGPVGGWFRNPSP